MTRNSLACVALAVLAAVGLLASVAWAGSVHFGGPVVWNVGSIEADGTIVGLGNDDMTVYLNAEVDAIAMCENKGGHQAPGRNPVYTTAEGLTVIEPDDISQNGRALFDVFGDLVYPDARDAGCPNGNWTVADLLVQHFIGTLSVVNDETGALELEGSWDCDVVRDPPETGEVQAVDCVQLD